MDEDFVKEGMAEADGHTDGKEDIEGSKVRGIKKTHRGLNVLRVWQGLTSTKDKGIVQEVGNDTEGSKGNKVGIRVRDEVFGIRLKTRDVSITVRTITNRT